MGYVKKKISVQDLELGMKVTELDRPWLETPLMFQGLEIRSQADISELRRFCKHVYIAISEHPDLVRASSGSATERKPPVKYVSGDHHKRIEFDLLKKVAAPQQDAQCYEDVATLEQEMVAASQAQHEAKTLISAILHDARMLKSMDTDAARHVVGRLTDSVLRNPDALMCFNQIRNKNNYTAEHSLRVCVLSLVLGRHLGLDREVLQSLGIGALLHDIGKVKLPDEIVNKTGRFTPQEAKVMQQHVALGVEWLEAMPGIPLAAIDTVREHHERYNGLGYPAGLKQNEIGLFGQICGIADYYDTMTSDWADHQAMSGHMAIRRIYELRDQEFHHILVGQLIQCMGVYPIGSMVELNTGDVGVVVTMNRVRRLRPRIRLIMRSNITPYNEHKIVDLMQDVSSENRPLEIERAMEAGTYGINPADYLPVAI